MKLNIQFTLFIQCCNRTPTRLPSPHSAFSLNPTLYTAHRFIVQPFLSLRTEHQTMKCFCLYAIEKHYRYVSLVVYYFMYSRLHATKINFPTSFCSLLISYILFPLPVALSFWVFFFFSFMYKRDKEYIFVEQRTH